MNISTKSKWAKHRSYIEDDDDDEICSCGSLDYQQPPFYLEKRRKSLSFFRTKLRSPKNQDEGYVASKLLPVSPKRIHSYKTFKVMVLGASNVGKTSLIERFIHGQFTSDHLPTIAYTYETGIFLKFGNELRQFDMELYDFCGSLKDGFPEIYVDKILQSDGFIVVHSKDEPDSLAKVVETVADINKHKEAPIVMVLENKCDCIKNRNNQLRARFQTVNARHMEVSAKGNIGVDEAITSLIYDLEVNDDIDKQNKKHIMSRFLEKIF